MMLIRGDARLLPLTDNCVDCVVTSPPYFGLRDYGTSTQIGLEDTPDRYIDAMCLALREIRRVLKASGTVWLNLGDSYGSGTTGRRDELPEYLAHRAAQFGTGTVKASTGQNYAGAASRFGKPKDLLGIPWRVAFALQADGWYLRSDIIWSKPNPMPESVTDRPTKSHEYLFLLTKSERYWYDAAAIAEPVSAAMVAEMEQGYDGLGLKDYEGAGVQNPSSVKARIIANARRQQKVGETPGQNPPGYLARGDSRCGDVLARNRRTVWTIPTMPYAGAHFATMPEALVEPCI